MIRLLRGVVADKSLESAILDCAGVGYELRMTLPDLASLPAVGQRCELHVHTYVREDTLRLYGFKDRGLLQVFEKLIAVSGVGPKMAIALLSGIDQAALARAVNDKDIARLSKVPGVGKKTAERLCLELRDKLDLPAAPPAGSAAAINVELVQALTSLGYKVQQVEKVAADLDEQVEQGAGLEELVREALRRMSGGK